MTRRRSSRLQKRRRRTNQPSKFGLVDLLSHSNVFEACIFVSLDSVSFVNVCKALKRDSCAAKLLQDSKQWRGWLEPFIHQVGHSDNLVTWKRQYPRLMCVELEMYMQVHRFIHQFEKYVKVIRGDFATLTRVDCTRVDALVFPADSTYLNPGFGVAGVVHARAGWELNRCIARLRPTLLGSLGIMKTPGFRSSMKALIHCPSPGYSGGEHSDRALYEVYLRALKEVARSSDISCAAVASISTGYLGYPYDKASRIALGAIRDLIYAASWQKHVAFVCYTDAAFENFSRALQETKKNLLHICSSKPVYPDLFGI